MDDPAETAVATLWKLGLNEDRVSCVVYRGKAGMQLRVESASAIILAEAFDFEPRMLARSRALRESLCRRGWREL